MRMAAKEYRRQSYQGEKPYIFISYAHKDSEVVVPVIKELIGRKYRVWYDEGIEVGANWPEVIANHLAEAAHVIIFSSAASARSQNCTREVNFAIDRKKDMSLVRLDDVNAQGGMQMQLSVVPCVQAQDKGASAIADDLEALGCITDAHQGDGIEGYVYTEYGHKSRINKWIVAIGVFALLFLATATAMYGMTQGWFSVGMKTRTVEAIPASGEELPQTESTDAEPVTVVSWNDPVTRNLLLSRMNESSLFVCGNTFVTSASAIRYTADGWAVGGETVRQGDFADFAAIAEKGDITELSMVYQQLTSLDTVRELPLLTYLDISGNEISSLEPLKELPQLKTLRLQHVHSADMAVLAELPALQRVYISPDMVDSVHALLNEPFDIILKE